MSEYQHQHEVSKFIGAPPGYAGHADGGQLTKRLKRRPDAVVLFDEVEKAHPDILTCLLQTFDEGRLTDGKGETVECMGAIFVMTSNLGQQEIAGETLRLREAVAGRLVEDPALNIEEAEALSPHFRTETMLPLLKAHFKRDEFLGRISEILYFLPFDEEQLHALVRLELGRWQREARDRHAVSITWDGDVERLLVQGYNVRFGVRSIQHEVDRKVVTRLAEAHEEGLFRSGDHMKVAVQGGEEVRLLRVEEGAWRQLELCRQQQTEPLLVPRSVVSELLRQFQRLQDEHRALQARTSSEGQQSACVLAHEKQSNLQLQGQAAELVAQRRELEGQVQSARESLRDKERLLEDTERAVAERMREITEKQRELDRATGRTHELQEALWLQEQRNAELEAGLRGTTSEIVACRRYYEEKQERRSRSPVRRIFSKARPEDWRPWHQEKYRPSEETVTRSMRSPPRTASPHSSIRSCPRAPSHY